MVDQPLFEQLVLHDWTSTAPVPTLSAGALTRVTSRELAPPARHPNHGDNLHSSRVVYTFKMPVNIQDTGTPLDTGEALVTRGLHQQWTTDTRTSRMASNPQRVDP